VFDKLKDAKKYWEIFAEWFLFWYKLWEHREGIEI
jgi:hypothetical protein